MARRKTAANEVGSRTKYQPSEADRAAGPSIVTSVRMPQSFRSGLIRLAEREGTTANAQLLYAVRARLKRAGLA